MYVGLHLNCVTTFLLFCFSYLKLFFLRNSHHNISSLSRQTQLSLRVARCSDILKPKIPLWVNFAGSCNGSCWYIL
jgi:hypothetical protein